MRALSLLFVASLLSFSLGCSWCSVATETTVVKTNLCDGDMDKLYAVYKVVRAMKIGKATLEEVEAAGFKVQFHHKTPNVRMLDQARALREIFTEAVFHGAFAEVRKNLEKNGKGQDAINALLTDVQPFEAYFIPFKVITTKTDRYYFSTKTTVRQGDDMMIRLLFMGDVLAHVDIRHQNIDTKESAHAFAQGVFDIIKEFLGPTDALYDLFDKIKEETKKDSKE